ncbi:hypothetical protein ZWY2020_012939 [Hordeum vulgare]|nr:hypothetical protein ZWY2020_012939 [Hordeum vulgare]
MCRVALSPTLPSPPRADSSAAGGSRLPSLPPPSSLPCGHQRVPPDLDGWFQRRRVFLSLACSALPRTGFGEGYCSAGGGPAPWQHRLTAGIMVSDPRHLTSDRDLDRPFSSGSSGRPHPPPSLNPPSVLTPEQQQPPPPLLLRSHPRSIQLHLLGAPPSCPAAARAGRVQGGASATGRCCDNIQGITAAIRRRAGGVKRISGLIYEETSGVLKIFLENVIRDAVTYTEHAARPSPPWMSSRAQRQGRTSTASADLLLLRPLRRLLSHQPECVLFRSV